MSERHPIHTEPKTPTWDTLPPWLKSEIIRRRKKFLALVKLYGGDDEELQWREVLHHASPKAQEEILQAMDEYQNALDHALGEKKDPAIEQRGKILEDAKTWNIDFFGQDVFDQEIKEIPPLPDYVTPELIKHWESLGFKLNYLPNIRMTEDRDFPGWRKKPNQGQNLFEKADQIQNLPENQNNPNLGNMDPLMLPGAWVLTDIRPKPNYQNGNQMYENDVLIQELLKKLAADGVLNTEASLGSRAKIHPSVFNKQAFWDAFAKLLGVKDIPGAKMRLSRVIEQNVQGQNPDWDGTNTYEWAEEYLESRGRLISGGSDLGGASSVNWNDGWNVCWVPSPGHSLPVGLELWNLVFGTLDAMNAFSTIGVRLGILRSCPRHLHQRRVSDPKRLRLD